MHRLLANDVIDRLSAMPKTLLIDVLDAPLGAVFLLFLFQRCEANVPRSAFMCVTLRYFTDSIGMHSTTS